MTLTRAIDLYGTTEAAKSLDDRAPTSGQESDSPWQVICETAINLVLIDQRLGVNCCD